MVEELRHAARIAVLPPPRPLTRRALRRDPGRGYACCILYTTHTAPVRPPSPAAGVSREPLAEQVAAVLRQRIYDRSLAPGQRLDEAEIAASLGVSRTPVREAFRRLAAWGLADVRARRGCYVAAVTAEDLEQIFPIMARLEGWVAHEVATRGGPEERARLDALHAELERHAAAGDADRYWEANYHFHTALQAMAGNRWLQAILDELRGKLNLARHRSLKLRGRMRASLAEHRALMRALRGRQASRAERLMRDHLMNQLEALHHLEHNEE